MPHHLAQAKKYHLPAPGPAIRNLGIVATIFVAGLTGYLAGNRRRQRITE